MKEHFTPGIKETAVNLTRGFKKETFVNIGAAFAVVLSMTSLPLPQHPMRSSIEGCRPSFGLQPQRIGSELYFLLPPDCYTLMGGSYVKPGFFPRY